MKTASRDTNVYQMRRRGKPRSRVGRIVGLALLFTIGLSFAFIYRVEAFRVKVVEVSGVERVNAERIYDDTKIAIGENMIVLPVSDMRANIMEQQPLVKNATIKRVLPSRVEIQIYERQPFAYVTNGKQFYLIDREGVVLEKTNGIADQTLFRVESNAIDHAEVGERLSFPNYEVYEVMCTMLDKYMKERYGVVRFDQRGIKLFLRDGTYVLLGDGEDMERKIMLVPIIIEKLVSAGEQFEGLNLEFLDVPSFIKKA